MRRSLEDLVNECREFIVLKNKNRNERNSAVGTPSYIVSKQWLKKYKEYILYTDVKRNNKPAEQTVDKHPGPMTNDEDLSRVNDLKDLVGTNTIEQFEGNYLDKYIRDEVLERVHFKIYNQELWTFLSSRYGGSEIKRYAVP